MLYISNDNTFYNVRELWFVSTFWFGCHVNQVARWRLPSLHLNKTRSYSSGDEFGIKTAVRWKSIKTYSYNNMYYLLYINAATATLEILDTLVFYSCHLSFGYCAYTEQNKLNARVCYVNTTLLNPEISSLCLGEARWGVVGRNCGNWWLDHSLFPVSEDIPGHLDLDQHRLC